MSERRNTPDGAPLCSWCDRIATYNLADRYDKACSTHYVQWVLPYRRREETLSVETMRVTAAGEVRPHLDRCDGFCNEIEDDNCWRCASLDYDLVCDVCRFYMAQDAEWL